MHRCIIKVLPKRSVIAASRDLSLSKLAKQGKGTVIVDDNFAFNGSSEVAVFLIGGEKEIWQWAHLNTQGVEAM